MIDSSTQTGLSSLKPPCSFPDLLQSSLESFRSKFEVLDLTNPDVKRTDSPVVARAAEREISNILVTNVMRTRDVQTLFNQAFPNQAQAELAKDIVLCGVVGARHEFGACGEANVLFATRLYFETGIVCGLVSLRDPQEDEISIEKAHACLLLPPPERGEIDDTERLSKRGGMWLIDPHLGASMPVGDLYRKNGGAPSLYERIRDQVCRRNTDESKLLYVSCGRDFSEKCFAIIKSVCDRLGQPLGRLFDEGRSPYRPTRQDLEGYVDNVTKGLSRQPEHLKATLAIASHLRKTWTPWRMTTQPREASQPSTMPNTISIRPKTPNEVPIMANWCGSLYLQGGDRPKSEDAGEISRLPISGNYLLPLLHRSFQIFRSQFQCLDLKNPDTSPLLLKTRMETTRKVGDDIRNTPHIQDVFSKAFPNALQKTMAQNFVLNGVMGAMNKFGACGDSNVLFAARLYSETGIICSLVQIVGEEVEVLEEDLCLDSPCHSLLFLQGSDQLEIDSTNGLSRSQEHWLVDVHLDSIMSTKDLHTKNGADPSLYEKIRAQLPDCYAHASELSCMCYGPVFSQKCFVLTKFVCECLGVPLGRLSDRT